MSKNMSTKNYESKSKNILIDYYIDWMKLVENRLVVKICSEVPDSTTNDEREEHRLFICDNKSTQLQPVISRKYGVVIDFDKYHDTGSALCYDGSQISLITAHAGTNQVESLHDKFSNINYMRLLVDDSILILFFNGGAYLRTSRVWHPFKTLLEKGYEYFSFLAAPQYFLRTDKTIYASYPFWEHAKNHYLKGLDKASLVWKESLDNDIRDTGLYHIPQYKKEYPPGFCDPCPITGIAESHDGHIWVSRGLIHFDYEAGSLYEYDGKYWNRVIPGSLGLLKELLISGVALMPTGELRMAVRGLGVVERKDNSLKLVYGTTNPGIDGINKPSGLIIDNNGRNFIITEGPKYIHSKIILAENENGQLNFQTLTLEPAADPVYLEELLHI
jgi:hypothetical protein